MRAVDTKFSAMWLALFVCVVAGWIYVDIFSPEARQQRGERQQAREVLDEIVASGKPTGFDKIDVGDMLTARFPVGTRKEVVLRAFEGLRGVSIHDDTPNRLVVRYDRGRAMFDVDPRTVRATFSFDDNATLVSVRAVHMKNQ